jgi:hypothetical protein
MMLGKRTGRLDPLAARRRWPQIELELVGIERTKWTVRDGSCRIETRSEILTLEIHSYVRIIDYR